MRLVLWIIISAVLWIGFLLTTSASTPAVVRLTPYSTYADLNLAAEYYIDPSRSMGIDQILKNDIPWRERDFHFNSTADAIWARVVLFNEDPNVNHRTWEVVLQSPNLTRVDFYIEDPVTMKVTHGASGASIPLAERPSPTRYPRIGIQVPYQQSRIVYVRVVSPQPITLRMQLFTERAAEIRDRALNFAISFCLNAMLTMFFYNLFLAVALRDRIYAHYLPWVAAVWANFFISTGYADIFLPHRFGSWISAMPAVQTLVVLSAWGFSREFLELRTRFPKVDRVYRWYIVPAVTLALLRVFVPAVRLISATLDGLLLSLVFLLIGAGFVAWRGGYRTAGFYLISWIPVAIVVPLYVAAARGHLGATIYPGYILLIGSTLEVLVLAFAVADRFNSARKEINIRLEQGVRERTRELEEEITERKRAEEQVVESSRLAALGEMAGGIAHEINSPLGTILLQAQLIRRELNKRGMANAPILIQKAAQVETTVRKISKIIEALRTFAREDDEPRVTEVVPLRQIVEETLSLCRAKFAHHGVVLEIEPVLESWPDEWRVRCRSGEIAEVLISLLNNAYDAVSSQKLNERWVRVRARREGPYFEISVVDSGPGVTPEIEKRIMEPFVTSKPVGKGAGLGLPISRGIVEAHGGHLWLDRSSLNTKFVFTLPAEEVPFEKSA